MARPSKLSGLKKWTARQLVSRVAAALVLLIVFALVLQVSVAGAFRSDAPAITLRWVPNDAAARAKLATTLVSSTGASAEARTAARALARDAIERDPLSPAALRAIGLAAQTDSIGRSDAVAKIMLQAERLSRRDQQVQIWLIEYYLRQGDFGDVLRHFDIALRTSVSSRDAVFPMLAAAAAEDQIANPLASLMARRPIWGPGFAVYLIDQGPDPARTVYLTRFLDPKVPDELSMIRSLLVRLGQSGRYDLAWDVHSRAKLRRAGAGGQLIPGGDFEDAGGYAPFAWTFVGDEQLWAEREADPTGKGTVLRVAALDGHSGEVGRQLLRLDPGTYNIKARFGATPAEQRARPIAEIRCASEGGARLAAIAPAQGGAAAQPVQARFTVPANCRYQWVAILASAASRDDGERPWIDDLAVVPAT